MYIYIYILSKSSTSTGGEDAALAALAAALGDAL